MRRILSNLPVPVLASIVLHAALVAGLFFVTGVVGGRGPKEVVTVVKAEADPRDEVEPEPPEVEPEVPLPEPEPEDARVEDEPIEEPPVFTEDFDPEDAEPSPLPPSDLPRIARRHPIGIGGGALPGGRAPPPPPEPEPPRPPGPTREAAAKHSPPPSYPPRAADRGYQGRVVLLVEVMPDGKVGRIEVQQSSGHRLLDEEAIRTVREWHFEPALVEGRPVRSLVEVPFSFELNTGR